MGSSSALAAMAFNEPLGLHDHSARAAAAPAVNSPVHGLQHFHDQLVDGLMCVELAAALGPCGGAPAEEVLVDTAQDVLHRVVESRSTSSPMRRTSRLARA